MTARVRREIRTSAELQEVCLRTLKKCPGFERVDAILIQPRDNSACEKSEGAANWTVAAVRPRVDNRSLRGARETIGFLQQTYQLHPAEVQMRGGSKRR
jgi:hypothetical protein